MTDHKKQSPDVEIAKAFDEVICGWSVLATHGFTEFELNSLVDTVAKKSQSLTDARIRRLDEMVGVAVGALNKIVEWPFIDGERKFPVVPVERMAREALQKLEGMKNEIGR